MPAWLLPNPDFTQNPSQLRHPGASGEQAARACETSDFDSDLPTLSLSFVRERKPRGYRPFLTVNSYRLSRFELRYEFLKLLVLRLGND